MTAAMVSSTGLPAFTIMMMRRGRSSDATRSFGVVQPWIFLPAFFCTNSATFSTVRL